jgi:hypothetical protein
VDLTPFRPHDLTPWRAQPRSAASRIVETVTMTRVEVTRARSFDGRGVETEWTFDERERLGEVATRVPPRAEQRTYEQPREVEPETASAFVHSAMTPLPTEGFLSLWERRHRGDHTGPAPRRAAAVLKAYDRAPF